MSFQWGRKGKSETIFIPQQPINTVLVIPLCYHPAWYSAIPHQAILYGSWMSWSCVCQHGKSLSKTYLLAKKCTPYDAIYIKFKMSNQIVYEYIIQSHTNIYRGIKSLNSVPRLPLGREGRDGSQKATQLFSRMFYLWKCIFKENTQNVTTGWSWEVRAWRASLQTLF